MSVLFCRVTFSTEQSPHGASTGRVVGIMEDVVEGGRVVGEKEVVDDVVDVVGVVVVVCVVCVVVVVLVVAVVVVAGLVTTVVASFVGGAVVVAAAVVALQPGDVKQGPRKGDDEATRANDTAGPGTAGPDTTIVKREMLLGLNDTGHTALVNAAVNC